MGADYTIPISVKGIVIEDGRVWLRKNQRDEWELPGGKIDPGEQPKETVVREIKEELDFTVKSGDLLDAFLIKIPSSDTEKNGVLVMIYNCNLLNKGNGNFEILHPGMTEFKALSLDELEYINIWSQYKKAITDILANG